MQVPERAGFHRCNDGSGLRREPNFAYRFRKTRKIRTDLIFHFNEPRNTVQRNKQGGINRIRQKRVTESCINGQTRHGAHFEIFGVARSPRKNERSNYRMNCTGINRMRQLGDVGGYMWSPRYNCVRSEPYDYRRHIRSKKGWRRGADWRVYGSQSGWSRPYRSGWNQRLCTIQGQLGKGDKSRGEGSEDEGKVWFSGVGCQLLENRQPLWRAITKLRLVYTVPVEVSREMLEIFRKENTAACPIKEIFYWT